VTGFPMKLNVSRLTNASIPVAYFFYRCPVGKSGFISKLTTESVQFVGLQHNSIIMNRQLVISVKDVRKSYGKKVVLHGGKMEAKTGELICIVGENGSGKSTLLRIIAGMLKPDKGSITYQGKLGYCPQQSLLYNYITVNEHFRLFGAAYGLSRSDIIRNSNELMEIFAFSDYAHFKVHQLSGGTQQKLNLSLSLLHDPTLLLLDEPYVGLDYEAYESFLKYTDLAAGRQKCIIMVTHLVFDRNHFNTIYHLKDGIIQEESV
jgi:ABC-2 type transport system ATP-binding protein